MSSNDHKTIAERVLNFLKRLHGEDMQNNYSINMKNVTNVGENWMGIINNVVLKGNDNEKNWDLIIKLAPNQERYRKSFPIRAVYVREIFVYDNVIVEFLNLQQEKKLANIFNPFVKCYTMTLDVYEEGVVMDNMKVKGFETLNYRLPMSYPHAELVIKELGKLHALSFAIRDQKPYLFKYFEDNCKESFFNSLIYKYTIIIITNLGKAVLKTYNPVKDRTEFEALQNSLKNVPDVLKSMLNIEKFGKYSVINHGDFQARNFLYKYEICDQSDVPTQFCIIDWQLSRIGLPVFDILHFFFVSTRKDFRDNHYIELLQVYYQSFSSFLRQLGSDPEALMSFDVLLQQLKEFSAFPFYFALWALAADMKKSEEMPDLYNNLTEDALVNFFSESPSDEYINAMRDVITHLIKYDCCF
ncbi:hypothetical protein RI129_008583 [Pyrocoelia pectoralis]|uniref:CHK kinase-like domain-containing protein n=1 Tax=Pyrocoelia pectoralis TaxID=417401 RepID=A0AAN7VBD1_9COLE